MKSIRIYCKNDGLYHDVPKGATLEEVYETLDLNLPCCKVNNRVEGLHYTINDSRDLEYLTLASPSGLRTYTRSLFFVLYKAVRDLYPEAELRIGTPVAGGYFCRLALPGGITPEVPERLRRRMAEIVASDLPFRRVTAHTTDAIEVFRRQGFTRKVLLLESIGDLYTHYYTLGETVDYFYSALLLRTGQLTVYDLVPFGEGLLLRVPDPEQPDRLRPMTEQHKMFAVFQEQHRRQEILGCTTVGELNTLIREGRTNDLVNVAEALQEKQIAQIADHIASHDALRVVLIADQMNRLLVGEEVELPRYDFPTGMSVPSGRRLRLQPDTILILEGNHALNPQLSEKIPDEAKYKIYASALTTISLDDHNYIPTTDTRLIRRICRDFKYRGYLPQEVIRRCPSVTAGEEKWIFPFQEEADAMFNSALIYELAALRAQALPLLEMVPECAEEYSEAYRLRKFISYFAPMPLDAVPPTSLLREFMGHSVFQY